MSIRSGCRRFAPRERSLGRDRACQPIQPVGARSRAAGVACLRKMNTHPPVIPKSDYRTRKDDFETCDASRTVARHYPAVDADHAGAQASLRLMIIPPVSSGSEEALRLARKNHAKAEATS